MQINPCKAFKSCYNDYTHTETRVKKMDNLEKLNKCKASLESHIARGNSKNQVRSWVLIDKYHALKETAQEEQTWGGWCVERNFSTFHDAYDYWA